MTGSSQPTQLPKGFHKPLQPCSMQKPSSNFFPLYTWTKAVHITKGICVSVAEKEGSCMSCCMLKAVFYYCRKQQASLFGIVWPYMFYYSRLFNYNGLKYIEWGNSSNYASLLKTAIQLLIFSSLALQWFFFLFLDTAVSTLLNAVANYIPKRLRVLQIYWDLWVHFKFSECSFPSASLCTHSAS